MGSNEALVEVCRPATVRPLLFPALVGGVTSMLIMCFSSLLHTSIREDLSHIISFRPPIAPAEHSTTLCTANTTFINPWPTWTGTATPLQVLRLLLSREYILSLFPTFNSAPPVAPKFPAIPRALQATWLGHAGMFMQQSGFSYLVDPLLSKYIAPFPLFGPQRLNDPPFASYSELAAAACPGSLDFVLLTHAHYDHLCLPDIAAIEVVWKPHYYVPHGVDRYLTATPLRIPSSRITTLQWWQHALHQRSSASARARITLTPAQHWSRRGLFDTNLALHGGFTVDTGASRAYFVGDSGYVPKLFEDIGRLLGPFDFAAIPIGAYAPRDIHASTHMDPEMALLVHMEVRSARSIGIHWGTFQLTNEPVHEPCEILLNETRRLDANAGLQERVAERESSMSSRLLSPAFTCVSPGEVLLLAV
jgi:N-acyl-phosphatidylethanolamine-hydrolysing phospholipase D